MNNSMLIISGVIIILASAYFLLGWSNKDSIINSEVKTQGKQMSFFIVSKNPGSGGNLGGLKGADAYCNSMAASAGITNKTWKAYLSGQGENGMENARQRIGNGPWYNYNGVLIANNLQELHNQENLQNNLNKQTALTEKGDVVSGRGDSSNLHDILTGSDMLGMAADSGTDTTCNNWTSSTTGSAIVGHHDRIGINETEPMKSWNSSHPTRGCSLENLKTTGGAGLFYCFATN